MSSVALGRHIGDWEEESLMTFDTTRGRVDEAEMPAAAEGRAPFRAWLYRLATNACLDFLARHERRVTEIPVRGAESSDSPLTPHVPWLQPFPHPDWFLQRKLAWSSQPLPFQTSVGPSYRVGTPRARSPRTPRNNRWASSHTFGANCPNSGQCTDSSVSSVRRSRGRIVSLAVHDAGATTGVLGPRCHSTAATCRVSHDSAGRARVENALPAGYPSTN